MMTPTCPKVYERRPVAGWPGSWGAPHLRMRAASIDVLGFRSVPGLWEPGYWAALAGPFIARWPAGFGVPRAAKRPCAGIGRVAGGWPGGGAHWPGAGRPSRPVSASARRSRNSIWASGAAQLVVSPSGQRVVDGGVQPQQDALALAHTGPPPALTGAAAVTDMTGVTGKAPGSPVLQGREEWRAPGRVAVHLLH